MGNFDSYLRMTVGSLSDTQFQLEDYTYSSEPVITDGVGRTANNVRIEGTGWIEDTSASSFESRCAAVLAALNVSGKDVAILSFSGSPIVQILAAQCGSGGPHCGGKMLEQSPDSPLMRRFSFTVQASQILSTSGPGGTGSSPGYTEKSKKTPDNLRQVTRNGSYTQAAATSYFLGTLLPAFRSTYPDSGWVVSYQYQADQNDLQLTWSISAQQLRQPYPSAGAGTAQIVDGDMRTEIQRDEQKRKITSYQFDLVLTDGDPQPVIDLIRSQSAGSNPILSERTSVTRYKENHLQASFGVLSGAEGNDLLNYQQELRVSDDTQVWRVMKFPGADPIQVLDATGTRIVSQSGSGTSCGSVLFPATPLYQDSIAGPIEVVFSADNDFEITTRWNYVMIADDFSPLEPPADKLNQLYRPDDPKFIPGT